MPPNMPPILTEACSSTFLAASLQAATIMSCSISTSPATSGSIFTPSTFFWPSILTLTMPPPAERFDADCCNFLLQLLLHLLRLLHHGLHIARKFHRSSRILFIQISHGSDMGVRKKLLKTLHARVGQGSLGEVAVGRRWSGVLTPFARFYGRRHCIRVNFHADLAGRPSISAAALATAASLNASTKVFGAVKTISEPSIRTFACCTASALIFRPAVESFECRSVLRSPVFSVSGEEGSGF